MTVKDYYEVIRDIDRLASAVDAEGAVTLDHDDAEQIWALLLDYKDLLMAKEAYRDWETNKKNNVLLLTTYKKSKIHPQQKKRGCSALYGRQKGCGSTNRVRRMQRMQKGKAKGMASKIERGHQTQHKRKIYHVNI